MSDHTTTLPMRLAVVNPLEDEGWNEKIGQCDDSTVFHTSNWARLLSESYGYHPSYLTLSNDDGRFGGCQPVMEVASLLTGRRGVSLTFSDYCPALVRNPTDFKVLLEGVLRLGKTSGWRYMEFRGEEFLENEVPAKEYALHDIELVDDEEKMQAKLRESTARNIRKARKEQVAVTISESLQGVRDFYRLHCLTRKRQGVPPQPLLFFDKLHETLISKGLGFTALAHSGNDIVSGIICLHFGSKAVYKYGASDLDFQHLRANNLVLWEGMLHCARRGCRSFCLGRTDLDNEGLLAFKNGWGATRTLLHYHKYDFTAGRFVCDPERDMAACKKLFKKLPVNVLRMVGKLAYRHMG